MRKAVGPQLPKDFTVILRPDYDSHTDKLGRRRCEEFFRAVQRLHPSAVATEMPSLANKYDQCTIKIPADPQGNVEAFANNTRSFAEIAQQCDWNIRPDSWGRAPYNHQERELVLNLSPRY